MIISPSLTHEAHLSLATLLNACIDAHLFQVPLRSLHNSFDTYVATCPPPFIAPDLIVTPEIRRQSELYLPIAEISRIFTRLYRSALTYPPVLSSTPFHEALSWADLFGTLPARLQFSTNPARLLEALLADQNLLIRFLFASFLPRRFYGGFGRYPGQGQFIREWLGTLKSARRSSGSSSVRCLDAACGTGEDCYGLATLLMESGFTPGEIQLEGWTLEPLEVWTATHRLFPYDPQREMTFRRETFRIFERGYQTRIRFRCVDLTEIHLHPVCLPFGSPVSQEGADDIGQFDLILCNGLLGGPIINEPGQLEQVVSNLAGLLAPGGILLAADRFHGGWKSKGRKGDLKALFLRRGLESRDTGEGIAGLKLCSRYNF